MSEIGSIIVASAAPQTPPPVVDAVVKEGDAPAAAAPTKDEPLSPKLNILMQKERAIVQKQQEFQKQQAEWNKEKESLLTEVKALREKDGISKQGAIKLLQAYGYSYEDATKEVMNEGGAEISALDRKYSDKIAEMEKKQADAEKAREDAAAKAKQEEAEKTIASFKQSLKTFIGDKKSEYKLVALFDSDAELVYDTIDAYYAQHNKVLDNAEAAGLVEKYFKKLVDDANGVLTPAQQAAGEKAIEDKKPGTDSWSSAKPAVKTLTNEIQTTVASTLPAKTENDRIKRALAKLEGKA